MKKFTTYIDYMVDKVRTQETGIREETPIHHVIKTAECVLISPDLMEKAKKYFSWTLNNYQSIL